MEAGECARPGSPEPPRAAVPWCRVTALSVIAATIPELKDLNGSMTTPEIASEIEALTKDCASCTEKLERIKSATNHVTPEEKEKVNSCCV